MHPPGTRRIGRSPPCAGAVERVSEVEDWRVRGRAGTLECEPDRGGKQMPLRDMDREQMWLLPPSFDELLPLDHPARFVAEFVDGLDREGWAEMGVEIEGGHPGSSGLSSPRATLRVAVRVHDGSALKPEAGDGLRDQLPYLWLTGWQHPDHNTLWRFYKAHRRSQRSQTSEPQRLGNHYSGFTYAFPDDFPQRLERFKAESGLLWAELARCLGIYPCIIIGRQVGGGSVGRVPTRST